MHYAASVVAQKTDLHTPEGNHRRAERRQRGYSPCDGDSERAAAGGTRAENHQQKDQGNVRLAELRSRRKKSERRNRERDEG